MSSSDPVSLLLSSFGLLDLPTPQKVGIFLGILTFVSTLAAVFALLTFGGSWRRIAAQDGIEIPSTPTARRALLLERLLESREWLKTNDGLTKLLCMEPVSENDEYWAAYRHCQSHPGGLILGGRPDHRFEAYARAFVGCGAQTRLAYRWSYARMYEALAGHSHDTEERYAQLWRERPESVIGRRVRLEPWHTHKHLKELWHCTSGNAWREFGGYNADELWEFWDDGPFATLEEMAKSDMFRQGNGNTCEKNVANMAIVEMLTDRLLGVIFFTENNINHLRVQMELPIVKPSSEGTLEVLEAYFLALDRLFAYGYRRIQFCVDIHNVRGKQFIQKLGFTQEGLLPKYKIIKEANSDCLIYGMLNSDWDKGARAVLFKKLHGEKAQKLDAANVAKEEKAQEEAKMITERRDNEMKKNT